jgi:hypothetical protein
MRACDEQDDTCDGKENERQNNDDPRMIPFHKGDSSGTASVTGLFAFHRLTVSYAHFLGTDFPAERTSVLRKIAFTIGTEIQI